jgi:hypothetical protein
MLISEIKGEIHRCSANMEPQQSGVTVTISKSEHVVDFVIKRGSNACIVNALSLSDNTVKVTIRANDLIIGSCDVHSLKEYKDFFEECCIKCLDHEEVLASARNLVSKMSDVDFKIKTQDRRLMINLREEENIRARLERIPQERTSIEEEMTSLVKKKKEIRVNVDFDIDFQDRRMMINLREEENLWARLERIAQERTALKEETMKLVEKRNEINVELGSLKEFKPKREWMNCPEYAPLAKRARKMSRNS